MPKLIILRGNSGSGKTTVAKELQKKFGRNTMIISQDVVRRDMLKVKDGPTTEALPLMRELLIYGKKHSEITILEGIMYADWYQPLFECAVCEFESEIYAYYFDLPFEETLQRHATKPNRADFGEQDMRRWWKEKDFIRIIPEKIVTKDFSISDTVNMIYDRLS
ncbi:MAG: kinase [Lachnospiraceae bacterium]|nr:kinase [Lachnospiraceae bacterium]